MTKKKVTDSNGNNIILPDTFESPILDKKIADFKEYLFNKQKFISGIKTSHVAKKRVIGKEYSQELRQYVDVEEWYLPEKIMRDALNKYFPGWNWHKAHEPVIIGNRAIVASGELEIIDVELFLYLTSIGIPKERAPFTRKFYGMGAALIQISKETGNPLNVSGSAKAADTEALKYSINRLTNFGDDTYKKETPDVGLTFREYNNLVSMIIESKMSDEDKKTAMGKLWHLSSDNIKKFIEIIKQKEVQND